MPVICINLSRNDEKKYILKCGLFRRISARGIIANKNIKNFLVYKVKFDFMNLTH